MSARNASAALANLRVWHHIDASGMVIGRLACNLAGILQGKHKPVFTPGADVGDYIVVTNAEKAHFSLEKKDEEKKYHWHTRYPGGLKTVTAGEVRRNEARIKGIKGRGPCQLIVRAVKGMLPRNSLRKLRLGRLKVFNDGQHPYAENLFKQNGQ